MAPFDPYPLVLLGLGISAILGLILVLRVNAFLALIAAALLVGFLSPRVALETPPGAAQPRLALLNVPTEVTRAFGDMMGRIGLVIALATIIGKALMDSGAADRIVRAFTRLFGQRLAPLALLVSGYVLAVPVFFDTVFLLLVPLAKALALRTGKDYLLYVTAIGAGGAITHSLVPPTPGPVGMAALLHVDLGLTILVGLLVGAPLAGLGYLYAAFANRMWPVPLRPVGTAPLEELERTARRPDHELPPLSVSLLPVLLPVVLITSSTVFRSLAAARPGLDTGFQAGPVGVTPSGLLDFAGNPNMALLLSTVVAMLLVARRRQMSRRELGLFTAAALDEAGMILLVTSAGGAFGAMLNKVGVGQSLEALATQWGVSLLVLAWAVAVLFKVAQGSGTVSMITTAGIVASTIPFDELRQSGRSVADYLGYHPVYLVMAIGCGSKVGSWMNDSGFWVVCKMGGLTEGETLKSWTMTLVVMGVAGLPLVWALTQLLPLR